MLDRIIELPIIPEPRQKLKGYGGMTGAHQSHNGGMWIGSGNNRRLVPLAKPCVHGDCFNTCACPDSCHFKAKRGGL